MEKEIDLSLQIIITKAKGENIIYYRNIDDRPRANYFAQLRTFRKDLIEVISRAKKEKINFPEYKLFRTLVNNISANVSAKDCEETLDKIGKIYEQYREQE